MQALNYSQLRKNLATTMETVCTNHEHVVITSGNKAVVMMSLQDFNSTQETSYLLSTQANRDSLSRSLNEHEIGETVEVDTDELIDMVERGDDPF